MNIVSFHKRDLQLVIQYLSVARITGSSEELWFFSANPNISLNMKPCILADLNRYTTATRLVIISVNI